VPSTDPDGHITKYVWNFGDGTIGDGTLVEHAYAAPGT
jgi:large repetitive protein